MNMAPTKTKQTKTKTKKQLECVEHVELNGLMLLMLPYLEVRVVGTLQFH